MEIRLGARQVSEDCTPLSGACSALISPRRRHFSPEAPGPKKSYVLACLLPTACLVPGRTLRMPGILTLTK